MTKETLQMIIEDNFTKAKHGDLHAIGVIAGAQAELKKIDKLEKDIAAWKQKFILVNKENVLLKSELKRIKLDQFFLG